MLKATSALRTDQVVQDFVQSGLQNLQDLQLLWATCSNVLMGKVFFQSEPTVDLFWIDEITIFFFPELTGQESAQDQSVQRQLDIPMTELTYHFEIETRKNTHVPNWSWLTHNAFF